MAHHECAKHLLQEELAFVWSLPGTTGHVLNAMLSIHKYMPEFVLPLLQAMQLLLRYEPKIISSGGREVELSWAVQHRKSTTQLLNWRSLVPHTAVSLSRTCPRSARQIDLGTHITVNNNGLFQCFYYNNIIFTLQELLSESCPLFICTCINILTASRCAEEK